MNNSTFAVVFSGELVAGANPEQVKANFAQLFKVDVVKVAPMFGGQAVIIKKGVDEATAKKYQQALLQVGALSQVIDQAASTTSPLLNTTTASSAVASPPFTPGLQASLAEPGAILKDPEPTVELQVDTSHLSMGAVGEVLIEPQPVAEFQTDLSALSMAEAGVPLITPSPIEALEIDLSALTLAEPGVVLIEPEEVAPAQIDTGKITLA